MKYYLWKHFNWNLLALLWKTVIHDPITGATLILKRYVQANNRNWSHGSEQQKQISMATFSTALWRSQNIVFVTLQANRLIMNQMAHKHWLITITNVTKNIFVFFWNRKICNMNIAEHDQIRRIGKALFFTKIQNIFRCD